MIPIDEGTEPADAGEVDSDRTERVPGVRRGKGSFAAPVPAFWSMERSETVAEYSGDRM